MPSATASPSKHSVRCIQELYIDEERLAFVLANGYGTAEPLVDDYEVAHQIVEYLRTCTKAGQVAHLTACGFDTAAAAEQLGMSPRMVADIKKEASNGNAHPHQ